MTGSGTVVDDWIKETTPVDRVKSIVMRVQAPRPVSWIADAAAVTTTEARDAVDKLSSDGVVVVIGDADGDRVVRPDSEHVRAEAERKVAMSSRTKTSCGE